MLTDEQVDYLLQIRNTTPPLPERTVRVMLSSLRWSPETIEHAIAFLKQPPAPADAKPPAPIDVADKPPAPPAPPRPIVIKQNPFPIGSPLLRSVQRHEEQHKKKKYPLFVGAGIGFAFFVVALVVYSQF
ncbi:MAG: hypothetical protein NUV54_01790 [Candidatus Taylorbacteria bacterium]|nr:hypothetical protein [Candidatus Taylorbacteria bacterium]